MTTRDDELSADDRQDSDYDGAWKEALRSHLSEFIECCFPALSQLVDWTCEPEWLDKEMSQLVGQSGHRNREVDLLFKVRLVDGREQWVLCHLEIQTSYEVDFAFRMDLYNAGLKWLFRQEVLTLVILADLHPDWRPCEHHFELAGNESYHRFSICKVLDRLSSDWADETSLAAQVARAQIAALRTAGDPQARYLAKTQLVRNLYRAGYNRDQLRELFRLIDWMMHLRFDLSQRFKSELVAYEKELQMPYVTSIERLAKAEGLAEGREEGREAGREAGREEGREVGREEGSAVILLRILAQLCGPLPEDVQQRVRQLSLAQRQDLSDSVLKLHSLTDLNDWMNASAD
jgi:hypothetical protein